MFDRLVELLIECIRLFQCWIVLEPYEEGCLVRLGKFIRVYGPGFHWCWPFYIDVVHYQSVTPSVHSLGDESATTRDGKSIGYHALVTYRIKDIEKATLEVHDVDHAIQDAAAGEIGRVLREATWDEITNEDGILERLTAACRKRGWKWGIEVMSVQLAGLALVRNIRLMQKI